METLFTKTFKAFIENSHDEAKRGLTDWCLVFLTRAKLPEITSSHRHRHIFQVFILNL
jgi:hypothetical protein